MSQKIGMMPKPNPLPAYHRRKVAMTPVPICNNGPQFKQDGVIYIPNYNNRKPKIIKMSELASVI